MSATTTAHRLDATSRVARGAYALAPRAARLVASSLCAMVVADTSQYVYSGLRKRVG